MISVDEALESVLGCAQALAAQAAGLEHALGTVLAEDVASDIDSPPHDKTLVDGYAVIADDVAAGRELLLLEEIVAGEVPRRPVKPGTTTRLMTGAPIPEGADAVVMLEETERIDTPGAPQRVKIKANVRAGQNILPRAAAMRRGEVVLRAGRRLRPSDVGLLAEVGRDSIAVIPRPTVAIISTGNELVPPSKVPGPGQIRNSNGPMLAALVEAAGGVPRNLGIARDEHAELRSRIRDGLASDVLLLSGGVSAGVLDLVPGVLAELGVHQVFHKVQLKPGKPLWFGTTRAVDSRCLVFGLPGNPVSSFVCCELFVRPALRKLAGLQDFLPEPTEARLAAGFVHKGNRPTYHPAAMRHERGETVVAPVAWQGSADLRALAEANALIHFPPGDRRYQRGESVEVLTLP